MTDSAIKGLHHVTGLASDAQDNLDFYRGILGLRMVKKTINFDAPDVYHLYYGDYEGSPGTLISFFPYSGIFNGRKGTGQLTVTSFSVSPDSLGYWMKRLDKFNIKYTSPQLRFDNEEFIYFEDQDGLGIELVANDIDQRKVTGHGHIPPEHAVKGLFGVTITQKSHENTAELLTGILNHELISEKDGRYRYSVGLQAGSIVDIVNKSDEAEGIEGSGSVHHVAFATENNDSQLSLRETLINKGIHVTPVIDRQYFNSVYFREPGGVLFEIATIPPGMAIDEDIGLLGENLKLPAWQEGRRSKIESRLKEIVFERNKFSD